MRVLFLNRCYGPDAEATGQLLWELCTDLAKVHAVSVVAGPSSSADPSPANGRIDGVEVARTWGTRFGKESLAGRLTNLASYFGLAAPTALRLGRVDVVVAETDPPLLGLLGAALKRLWGCGFVYYCQDIYPDVAEATGGVRNQALLRLLHWANEIAYRAADRVVVLGGDMRERLLAKGVPAEKIAIVPNWTDVGHVRPVRRGSLRVSLGDRFVVMYSGNFGLTQPLELVLRAAERMRNDARIVFALIGDGVRRDVLRSWARRARLENVVFLPYQPRAELSESLGAADIHLVPLRAGLSGCLVPSKVYGVLAAGRPLIALMQPDAEVARLVREAGIGWVVDPDDLEGLVSTILEAMSDREALSRMGERARLVAEERFDRTRAVEQFAQVLARLAP